MRLIYALRNLIKHYPRIMPTYLVSVMALFIGSHVAPILGTVLLLPVSVGVAFVMVKASTDMRKKRTLPILMGFKAPQYGKNVWYLLLRQILYISPIVVGTLISGFVFGLFQEINVDMSAAMFNLILFSIPAAIISLMLAMVPYLLADSRFNQLKHNPLKVSAVIMKGQYLKLMFIRLFFVPWMAIQSSGLLALGLSYYRRLFGGDALPGFLTPTLLLMPLAYLLFLPWYHMRHAQLYADLRHKVKNYR